jgi:hypothetical protein
MQPHSVIMRSNAKMADIISDAPVSEIADNLKF